MDQNFRLGKIAGIPVGLNWSVLSSSCCWPGSWPTSCCPRPAGPPRGLYWVAGTATTVLFLRVAPGPRAAHALVAKRHGIGVRSITLWLFGGVSELEGEALTPAVEFRVAGGGPLTSLAVALAAGGCSLLLHTGPAPRRWRRPRWDGWPGSTSSWAGSPDPGRSLDGGRILRAVLWHRSGDRVRATTIASRCGEAFGYALVVLGSSSA